MTEQIAAKLAELRRELGEAGAPIPPSTSHFRDQAQTSFRLDLLESGIDPSPENLPAALAGFLVGIKVGIQQNLPLALIAQYVGLCESLLPMLDQPPVDTSTLPDLGFMDSWSIPEQPTNEEPEPESQMCANGCGTSADVLTPWGFYCAACALRKIRSVIEGARPQVGGPNFNRGPDPVADVGPKRFWDMTINDLIGRKGKHRRKDG